VLLENSSTAARLFATLEKREEKPHAKPLRLTAADLRQRLVEAPAPASCAMQYRTSLLFHHAREIV
jgi:hypothetical protein